MNNNILGIKDLMDFMNFLNDKEINFENNNCAIYYSKDDEVLVVDQEKLTPYRKVPSLTGPRFIESMKLLETMSGKHIPIIDKITKKILFTKEEFLIYRKKMSGLKEYNTGDYIFSDNLYFDGLDYYLNLIDDNINNTKKQLNPIILEFKRVIESIGLSVTTGSNSGGNVELIEAGSTTRYTNVSSLSGDQKSDFDFTIRIDPDKTWYVKEALETKLNAGGHITRTSSYKVRLTDVIIPNLEKKVDLDFSLTPQKEKYLSTEDALSERLNNMKEQDELKYRLVLANIMYAKDILKKAGAYKVARGILDGNRDYGGLGGVGIESWILQYGGSFIDAAKDFIFHAEGRDFIDFEKEYAIMDFGQDHVSTSKKEFPYHNFIMRNMRYKGYEIMKTLLYDFIKSLENQNNKKIQ